jgi:Tol biopolymer transport system component/tRNA A-37 threonylcarbamoyl transferase component Bud32
MALAPGTRVGPFEIAAQLGVGGMGEVYRATDTRLKRQVAIKILPTALASDAERLARFQREAEVLASLNHPNIAALYGLEEAGGVKALVMELVEGPTLADRIALGALPIDEALAIARQLVEALDTAHDRGIVHRDLKPANIKVRPDGTVKVLDFGLAKVSASAGVDGADAPGLSQSPTITSPAMMTQAGVILGTAAYMSPEQAKGREADRRSDIWAFGCVLYEMVTGVRAFPGEDVGDTLGAVLRGEADLTPLPPRVRRLVSRCLTKDPRRRLRDIGDALELLEDVPVPPAAAGASASRLREYTGWGVAALVAVAALIVNAMSAARAPGSEAPLYRLEVATPPTEDPTSFAISPDGRQLVFAATVDGVSRLWLRGLDETEAQPLPGTEEARWPFWSPDSRAIAFFAGGKLKRLDLPAGPAIDLADAPSGRGGTWNDQGMIVFSPLSIRTGLMRVPATGGMPEPVTTWTDDGSGSTGSHRFPVFLPGGRFVFMGGSGLYLGTLDDSEPVRLFDADSGAEYASGHLLFVRQGVLWAAPFDTDSSTVGMPRAVARDVTWDQSFDRGGFSVSANGVLTYRAGGAELRQLTWVDRSGKTLGTVGQPDDGNILFPELSPDQRQVAIHRERDVWLFDERGTSTRFTSGQWPVWSPEGTRLILSLARDRYTLREHSLSGTPQERVVLTSDRRVIPLSWSPDARYLLYSDDTEKGFSLRVLPLDGAESPSAVAGGTPGVRQGQFSPDGRWIAYTSDESGQDEVYVRPFPAEGRAWRVSASGGKQPRWRRDGRELYYIAADTMLTAVSVDLRGETPNIGSATPLFPTRLPQVEAKAQYAVVADGQRFLLNTMLNDRAPIVVAQNWPALLER